MPLPGFVEVYNCLPYPLDFQCAMKPYVIEPHKAEVMTVDMAIQAIKHSMYFMTMEGTPFFGAVIVGDPDNPAIPLTMEQINEIRGESGSDLELQPVISHNGENYNGTRVVSVGKPQIARRQKVDPKIVFMASGGEI